MQVRSWLFALGLVWACGAVLAAADCNGNGLDDGEDIAAGLSADCNGNDVPDACEVVPIDLALGSETIAVSAIPRLIEKVDLDGDGDMDLVQTGDDRGLSTLTVVLNLGARQFSTTTNRVDAVISDFTLGDFDEDGDPDLVTSNRDVFGGEEFFLLLRNRGGGELAAPSRIEFPFSTRSITSADLDGDGHLDLVTPNRGEATLSRLRGHGDGTFDAPTLVPSGANSRGIVAVDFDGDGALDLATLSGADDAFSVLLADGQGGFAAPVSYALGDRFPRTLHASDLDADGAPDLIGSTPRSVSVLLNHGDGTFAPTASYPALGGSSFSVGDLDGDLDLDLAIAVQPDAVSIKRNDGAGGFDIAEEIRGLIVQPTGVSADDFDGDGFVDLALLTTSPSSVQFFWHEEDVTRIAMREETVPLADLRCNDELGCRPHAAALGDLDGDGDPDAIAFIPWPSVMIVALNEGGTLVPRPATNVVGGRQPRSAAIGDLDGNGTLDVAVVDNRNDTVTILSGEGDGSFGRSRTLTMTTDPLRVRLADFDGDGTLDIVGSGTSVGLLLNRGDLAFRRQPDQRFSRLRISGTSAVTPLDADGDGLMDLAIGHDGATNVSITLNTGDATFTEVFEDYPLSSTPHDLRAGDFDGDGHIDIASANSRASVGVLLNRGTGRFGPARDFTSGWAPLSLLIDDMDGDDQLDVVTASESGSNVSVLLGLGDGSLRQPAVFSGGAGLRFVRAGDLDLDGDVDLVTYDRISRTLTALYNETPRATELPGFEETICTEADFHQLARAVRPFPLDRTLPFLIPSGGAPPLPPLLFLNGRRFATPRDFLDEEFPATVGALTPKEFLDLTVTRSTRRFHAGEIQRVRTDEGLLYGFTLQAQWHDPDERPGAEEVKDVYDQLASFFELRPLAYLTLESGARQAAAAWEAPGFPMHDLVLTSPAAYAPYTQGVAFGYVRVLGTAALPAARRDCTLEDDDIVVLSGPPRSIGARVSALVTVEPQDETGLLAVRTNRSGTPNLHASDALERLAPLSGKLVRIEVGPAEYAVRGATLDEAEAFWSETREELSAVLPDRDFGDLPTFEDVEALDDGDLSLARFGGHVTRLVRARPALGGALASAREHGFAIPAAHFLRFLRSNRIESGLEGGQLVTYEEYLSELRAQPFLAASTPERCDALRTLTDAIRTDGQVDAELVQAIGQSLAELFGGGDRAVRLLPSTNVDAPLTFSSVGRYADVVVRGEEEIAAALRKVWASLLDPEVASVRESLGLPIEQAAMSLLVVDAAESPRATGVVLTGSPRNPRDRRMLVRVQPGEASVFSEDFGVHPETVRLLVGPGGAVGGVVQEQASSLVRDGTQVLEDDELRELGRLAWTVEQGFPVALANGIPQEVRLEVGFRLEEDGTFVVTSVTPFLLHNPVPPLPTFELEVPAGTTVCGMFAEAGAQRGPREEYELKTEVRLRAGVYPLVTDQEDFEADLIEEVVFGPTRSMAFPQESGRFERLSFPDAAGATVYRFTYRQLFEVETGQRLEIQLVSPLSFTVGEGQSDNDRRVLDEEFFTTKVGREAFQALLDDEPLIRFGSCTHRLLERFEISVVLDDGTELELVERFREADTLFETGPASLQRAEVVLGGERQVISDRFRLVYSASRHNAAPRYLVILEQPVSFQHLDRPITAIELAAAAPEFGQDEAEAFYLDEDFGIITKLGTVAYTKEVTVEPGPPTFRRGDVNQDTRIDITDALALLGFLFRQGVPPACAKAADANDDGRINLLDAIAIPGSLFGRIEALPAPAGECGVDPTLDELGCDGGCGG